MTVRTSKGKCRCAADTFGGIFSNTCENEAYDWAGLGTELITIGPLRRSKRYNEYTGKVRPFVRVTRHGAKTLVKTLFSRNTRLRLSKNVLGGDGTWLALMVWCYVPACTSHHMSNVHGLYERETTDGKNVYVGGNIEYGDKEALSIEVTYGDNQWTETEFCETDNHDIYLEVIEDD